VLKRIAETGLSLALAFLSHYSTGHDGTRREDGPPAFQTSRRYSYAAEMFDVWFFPGERKMQMKIEISTPKGYHDNASSVMSLVIGIVLFGISFYLWYLVKEKTGGNRTTKYLAW
jgi:hypothetical protein